MYVMEITVSNDGVVFSETERLYIYDSLCMNCNGTSQCQQKVGLQKYNLISMCVDRELHNTSTIAFTLSQCLFNVLYHQVDPPLE